MKITLIALAVPIILTGLFYLLLRLPPVQQKIKEIALSELMEITHNRIKINKLSFTPFHHLRLEGIYAEDLKGDTLLYAENLDARLNLWKLWNNQLIIKDILLDDFIIKIQKDSVNADFNFQFLIDAFAFDTPDTTASKFQTAIKTIRLQKGKIEYNVLSEVLSADSLFDFNHIQVHDIQLIAELQIKFSFMDIQLKQLAFSEKSGFAVQDLRTKFQMVDENYSLHDFRIRLPRSELNIPQAVLSGDQYQIVLSQTNIHPQDIRVFYAPLAGWNDTISISGESEGRLPQLNLHSFQMACKNRIRLNMNALMDDYTQWQTSPLQVDLEELSADSLGMDVLQRLFFADLPLHLGSLRLTGFLRGKLNRLQTQLTAQTHRGDVFLTGSGGYDFSNETAIFDFSAQTLQLDVKTLLNDSQFGLASLQVQAKGQIPASGKQKITADAIVNRFDYNGYAYNRMTAQALYSGDSIRLDLNSDDGNLPLRLAVSANVGKKSPSLHLNANLDCVYVDTLHFLPDYRDVFLMGKFRVDVRGFDPEKTDVAVAIDSLLLMTNQGMFGEPAFRFNYHSNNQGDKQLTIDSDWLRAQASGRFTYTGILEALKETFPVLFPKAKPFPKKREKFPESLQFYVGVNHLNDLAHLFSLPQTLPDSALFIGNYGSTAGNMRLSASAYTRFSELDTLQLSVSLSNKANNLSLIFNADNKSSNYDFDGSVDAEIEFLPAAGNFPDMNVVLNPSVLVLNERMFDLNPAQIEIREGRYSIHDFAFHDVENDSAFIRIDGIVAAGPTDSLAVNIAQFPLSSFFSAMKSDFPLSGMVHGQITGKQILSTPMVFSRDFAVDSIVVAGRSVGDLRLTSGWSSERQGLALRATLSHEDHPPSTVRGYYRPDVDSVALTAKIHDIELQWFQEMMNGSLFGLSGDVGADIQISGKLTHPNMEGILRFNQAQAGISMLNTRYTINDSIRFDSKSIELKNFKILDENQHALTANGRLTHNGFSGFRPDIRLSLSDFMVLNNPKQTDSLFYGTLRINGLLSLKPSANDWLLSGDITHGDHSSIRVNIRSSAGTAQHYDYITYFSPEVNDDSTFVSGVVLKPAISSASSSFPFKTNLNFWFDPGLKIGAVFNAATGDAADVTGNGSIRLLYDLPTSNINLQGNYEIDAGTAGLTIANIARKTFKVQRGGELVFRGDPMATTFDLTAVYNLRTDLTTLDPSFANLVVNPQVPVNCALTAKGSIDEMQVKYNILLPNESDDTQRKVNGLIYTDDMKIKELAYLLAFGSFLPAGDNAPLFGASQLVNSLAALSSGGLNQLLSGVLSDKWSIGTDVRTRDAGFDQMDMDLNVSGRLFNDRLTINGTVGYHNNSTQINNFTGDFAVEYKLIPSGNLLLKAYNATNNSYYEQAPTTQGLGLVYKRQAKTFKQLFGRLKK